MSSRFSNEVNDFMLVSHFAEVIAAMAMEFGNGYKCEGADFMTIALSRDSLRRASKGYVRVDINPDEDDDKIIINVVHDLKGRSFEELQEMFDEFMDE